MKIALLKYPKRAAMKACHCFEHQEIQLNASCADPYSSSLQERLRKILFPLILPVGTWARTGAAREDPTSASQGAHPDVT